MKTLAVIASLAVFGTPSPAPDQTKDLEHHSPTKAGERIEIRGLSGSEVEFKSWNKDEVAMFITVRIESSDEEFEEDYVKSLGVHESRRGGILLLEFRELRRNTGGSGFWRFLFGGNYVRKEIRGEVFVPQSNPLTTDFRYGSIALSDMKGELNILGKNNTLSLKNCSNVRRVENDYGTSALESCGGNLTLSGTSSTVTVDSHAGGLDIDARYSTIRITGIEESSTIKSQSGKITAETVGGDLAVHADYSTIKAANIKGTLDIKTKSGSVQARQIEAFSLDAPYTTVEVSDVSGKPGFEHSVSGQSGSFRLENVKGNIQLDGPYTNADLRNIQGSVHLRSKSSRITASGVSGDWKSHTEYSTIRLRGLKSRMVEITNKSNPVTLELLSVPETINIRNEYGGVSASLPNGFSGEVALDAEYGKIETDFSIRVRERGSSAYAVGTVGSGSGSISIETKSGNIDLLQK